MSTPPPNQQNSLTGYCEVWNGYFIGTMAGTLLLVAFNTYISYRRDKFVTKGKIDWGIPWGAGVFIFNIGIWNLLPPNIFFLLFKVSLPNFNALAPEMACFAVQNLPIITVGLVLLGMQIVFLYNPKSAPEVTRPWLCDDTDIQPEESNRGEEEVEGAAPVVIMFGAPSRGRLLCERLQHRMAFEKDPANNKYVAPKTDVILFNAYSEKERDFVRENLEIEKVEHSLYQFITPERVSHDNVFKLPHADNSVDKVIWSMFIRNAAPIGSMATPEKMKAQKMAMVLDEVFRVLKPGAKFISVDSADRGILTYADLRDSIGEEQVEVEEDVCKVNLTPFFGMRMFKVVGTKPKNFVSTGRMHLTKAEEESETRKPTETDGLLNEESDVANESFVDPKTGEEVYPDAIPAWQTMLVMLLCQTTVFFVLCFAAAALYMPLNIPSDVTLSQRAGNVLHGIPNSFANFAFFEREIVLNTKHFNSVGSLLFWELKGSTITILLSILVTAVFTVPTTALQIGLTASGINDTLLGVIGMAISFVVGTASYKYGTYLQVKQLLESRNLDHKKYKKWF